MAGEADNRVHTLTPQEAAQWLGIDEGAVRSLVQARYLSVVDNGIPMAELRSFQARNAESGNGPAVASYADLSPDFDELVEMLSQRTEELAVQALEQFLRFTPQARQWSGDQRETFLAQARGRFDAVLAVVSHTDIDNALQDDLREVGMNAAWAGSSLPHLLLVLRISRDLLMSTAMDIAQQGQGRWDAILRAFTVELLPAIDRLTDAISGGYWQALVDQSREDLERLVFLVENSPYGVYEADIDGMVQYANPALAAMVGRPGESLVDLPLSEVFRPVKGSVNQLLAEPAEGVGQVNLVIPTRNGDQELDVDTVVRRIDTDAIGFGGIARIATIGPHIDLSPMARHIFELRRSVEILEEAGIFVSDHAKSMKENQIKQVGDSIRRQGERLMLIVDELDEERKRLS